MFLITEKTYSPGFRGSWVQVGLVFLAFALTTALAWQATQEGRRSRVVAERVLHDHAESAVWQFARSYRTELDADVIPALSPVLRLPAPSGSALPPVGVLQATAARSAPCHGDLPDSNRYYFRLDLHDTSVTAVGAPTRLIPDASTIVDSVLPWVGATGWIAKGFRNVDGVRRLLIFGVRRSGNGDPVAVYGFETCLAAIIEAAPRVFHESPLLPPVLTGGRPNDSLLALTVTRNAGHDTLYASAVRYPGTFRAVRPSEGLRGLEYEVTLRPDIAETLLIGGLPRSRVPMLLGLLTLTLGVAGMLVVQLRREQALAAARADFVASVSHELRTPLAQILLFGESLRLPTQSDENRELAADVIVEETERLSYLVENVLHFSRGRAGQRRRPDRPIPLAPLLRSVVARFAPLTRDRRVAYRIEADERVTAFGDPHALRQVLLNLLDNAVKFGPAGQCIILRVAAAAGCAQITVEDQGPGIAHPYRERVWRPFFRIPGATDGVTGSGLGLGIVRDLVTQQGGRVWHERAPGSGTRFVIELPAPAAARNTEEPRVGA